MTTVLPDILQKQPQHFACIERNQEYGQKESPVA